jgi:hypothetical protein
VALRAACFALIPVLDGLTSIRLAMHPDLITSEPLACLMSISQYSRDLVHHISRETFQITLPPAPARLEAEQLGGVWSPKTLSGNAIWLDDRFMSPRISPVFFPGEVPASYGLISQTPWPCHIAPNGDPRLLLPSIDHRFHDSFQFLCGKNTSSIPSFVCTRPFQFSCCQFGAFLTPLSSSGRALSYAVVAMSQTRVVKGRSSC